MTFQRLSETPRKGITEQEQRVADLLRKLGISYHRNRVYCFLCRHHFENTSSDRYPSMCLNCRKVYDEPGQYCMPDFIITGTKILNINGGIHEKNKKHIEKDRYQVRELLHDGNLVFILNNEEMDNMHNATLIAYLLTIAHADSHLWHLMYDNEKEYPCLVSLERR